MILYISIFVVIVAACVLLSVVMMKKQKDTAKKYEGEAGLSMAVAVKDDLLQHEFSELSKQMNGAPIDAFTQCAYIATVGDKIASAAATAAKTAAWAAVGVKAKYQERDNASYLILSNQELHYIFFDEGEARDHLVFDHETLLDARPAQISSSEKVTRMGSIMGLKPKKMHLDVNGNGLDLIYYGTVQRMPAGLISPGPGMFEAQARFQLMGRFFLDRLYQKYPQLQD
ncbi:hypothetical protein K7A41_11080 [Sphingobacterium sp. InxBP1]|uniref:hypothetical protein n=1 Tax=Sphingobacterium TaxID=28453 RepID=UPI002242E237|nr:hypothetical protein [Sphingobacterium sp. InxBP1]MCW8311768.1 hypothetical protein [Sphingobacterium sp. InxBP1]